MTQPSEPVRACARWRCSRGWRLEVPGEGEEKRAEKPKLGGVRVARTGPASAMTDAGQPIRAGRGEAQPISGRGSAGASVFARELPARVRGGGDGGPGNAPGLPRGAPRLACGSAGPGRRLPGDRMASEGPAGELEAVLAGQGPRVQSWDSEPAGELPAPVRLRRNVCYVVLAVFLNEQVSVRRRPGPARPAACPRSAQPAPWGPRTYRQEPALLCGWRFPVLQSTVILTTEPCAPNPEPCDCQTHRGGNRVQEHVCLIALGLSP